MAHFFQSFIIQIKSPANGSTSLTIKSGAFHLIPYAGIIWGSFDQIHFSGLAEGAGLQTIEVYPAA
jgi:hypothetical protein